MEQVVYLIIGIMAVFTLGFVIAVALLVWTETKIYKKKLKKVLTNNSLSGIIIIES